MDDLTKAYILFAAVGLIVCVARTVLLYTSIDQHVKYIADYIFAKDGSRTIGGVYKGDIYMAVLDAYPYSEPEDNHVMISIYIHKKTKKEKVSIYHNMHSGKTNILKLFKSLRYTDSLLKSVAGQIKQ